MFVNLTENLRLYFCWVEDPPPPRPPPPAQNPPPGFKPPPPRRPPSPPPPPRPPPSDRPPAAASGFLTSPNPMVLLVLSDKLKNPGPCAKFRGISCSPGSGARLNLP